MDRKFLLILAKNLAVHTINRYENYYNKNNNINESMKKFNMEKFNLVQKRAQIEGQIKSIRDDGNTVESRIRDIQHEIADMNNKKSVKSKRSSVKIKLKDYQKMERNIQNLIKRRLNIDTAINNIDEDISQIKIELTKLQNKMSEKKKKVNMKLQDLLKRSKVRVSRISQETRRNPNSRNDPRMRNARLWLEDVNQIKSSFDTKYAERIEFDEYQSVLPNRNSFSKRISEFRVSSSYSSDEDLL